MNHSDSSNQTFLPSAPNLVGCNPLKPEIGKEDIRFPAFPFTFWGKAKSGNKPAKLVFGLKREESAIAECPITGIVLSIGIPALPFSLTYENPIAKERNARKIAALPLPELQALENDILAGVFLSLLSANSLIKDKKTGLERNNLLCQHYSSASLIEMIQTISRILNHLSKPERLKKFLEESPLLCLNESADNIMPTVKGWLLSITPAPTVDSILKEEKVAQAKLRQAVQVRQSRGNISLSLRSRIKALALELGKQEVISQKASSIFQFLGTGQNWKTLTKDSKVSYIAYLSEKLISSANESEEEEQIETLIALLKEIPVLDTYNALTEEDDSVSSQADKNAGREEKTMTIQERLAAIAAKTKGKGA